MTEIFIVAGCYVALWSNAGGVGPIARQLIFICLFCAALLAVVSKKVQRISTTPTELILYLVGILSAAVSLVRSEEYSINYSIYFLTALIFISVLARAIPLERLLDLAAIVILLCIGTCFAAEGRNLFAALSISVGQNGLLRFSPLGNHPLLIGDIFGAGSILLLRRLSVSRNIAERSLMVVGVALAWVFVLAASARSSIIALLVSAVFAAIIEFRLLKNTKAAALAAISIATLVLLYFAAAQTYLQDILAVNSEYRGVGTGATGRTDLWLRSLEALVAEPSRLALGGALRSSESNLLGFFTENSYMTILLDSGIFVGSALIFIFLSSPFNALRSSRTAGAGRESLIFLPSFFVFLLVQSFFIRDLLGLGNPIALITLIALVSLSMRAEFLSKLQKARQEESVDARPATRLMRART